MSVISSVLVPEAIPSLAVPLPSAAGADPSFDARWATWIQRGRRHDRTVRRRLRIASLGAAVVGVLAAIFFGFAAGAR